MIPSRDEPNNQTAAGIGTADMAETSKPEKLMEE